MKSWKSFLNKHKAPVFSPPPSKELPLVPSRSQEANSLSYQHQGQWLPCTVHLHNTTISVSWFDTDAAVCTHDISLKGCYDIRSVSSDNDTHVFELLFRDSNRRQTKESFAVATVRERAKWIRAFWAQITPPLSNNASAPAAPLSHPAPPRMSTDRSLPPLPISRALTVKIPAIPETTPVMAQRTTTTTSSTHPRLPAPISPVSAYSTPSAINLPAPSPLRRAFTTSPPPLPPSTLQRPTASESVHSRTKSPSITNLSRLSVVKGRLAEMEQLAAQSEDSLIRSTKSTRRFEFKVSPMKTSSRSATTDPGDDAVRKDDDVTQSQDEALRLGEPATTSTASTNSEKFESLLKRVQQPSSSSPADGLPIPHSGPPAPDDLSAKVESIHRVLGSGEGPSIRDVALGLDQQLKGATDTLGEVKQTLATLERRLDSASKGDPNATVIRLRSIFAREPEEGEKADVETMTILRAIKTQLASSLPVLEERIREVALSGQNQSEKDPRTVMQLEDVKGQLDQLLKLSRDVQDDVGKGGRTGRDLLKEISHLASLMEAERAHREQQVAQQADSVRYLNELNTWLEAFVNSGSSHIQALASSIEHLCAELGSTSGNNNHPNAPPGGNLLHEVRQLVVGMKARDQSMAGLQAAVNDLVVGVGSRGAGVDEEMIKRMMEVQRRNAQSMLKVLSDELSGEIKGERLRFVEAMKEATAINVQMHVDELKKEMGKEVFAMAQQVERLHRDKQDVESRIAELMAFYSKQTAASSSGFAPTAAAGAGTAYVPGAAAVVPPMLGSGGGSATMVGSGYGYDYGSGYHPSQGGGGPAMKPVMDLRMRPLGSSSGRPLTSASNSSSSASPRHQHHTRHRPPPPGGKRPPSASRSGQVQVRMPEPLGGGY